MAEGAPLLREYTLTAYRGFESLLHRQYLLSEPGPYFLDLPSVLNPFCKVECCLINHKPFKTKQPPAHLPPPTIQTKIAGLVQPS